MKDFFSFDNGIFAFLSKICDLLFLSILWLLFCIPIFTIGPANTALYYTTVKVIRRERGYMSREFVKSFRANFKQGAITGVLLTIIFAILIFDLIWSWGTWKTSNKGTILFGLFMAITFLVFCFSLYVFPVLSRFDMKFKQLLKVSALMSIKHILYTLGIAITTIASMYLVASWLILIFILPALTAYINSFLMERVFKKYMPKTDDAEQQKDEWYLE